MTIRDVLTEAERRADGFRADELMHLAQKQPLRAALARKGADVLEALIRDTRIPQEVLRG